MKDPTQRFTSRVDDYVKYRPGYPARVLEILREGCGLASSWAVADAGSGTGILSELFLKNGNIVYAIEPNAAMRAAAERRLKEFPNFYSIAGRAEATGLVNASIDLVCAGQAFHWFEPGQTRREFARILKPGGWVALIWNERRIDESPFSRAYEALLRGFAPEYEAIRHSHIDDEILRRFFAPGSFEKKSCENAQIFDYAGIEGRMRSSSYVPEPGHPRHAPLRAGLKEIFDRYNEAGLVRFEYVTLVYFGKLAP